MLGSVSIWAPLVYQYSIGGLLFLVSLVVVVRSRACDLRRTSDRFWLVVLLAGMAAYFAAHLSVYLLAIYAVRDGAGGGG